MTKQFNSGKIIQSERQLMNKRIDNARVTLDAYINHYENKVKTMKGSGIRKKSREVEILYFFIIQISFSKN